MILVEGGFCSLNQKLRQEEQEVRHELGQATKDQSLEDIHIEYDKVVTGSAKEVLNAGIFDGKIPVAKHVEREKEETNQVTNLLLVSRHSGSTVAQEG